MTKARYSKIQQTLSQRQLDATIILDEVHKPYNLAAIMRTADAVGVQQMHAVYPKPAVRTSVKASAGTKRWVDVTTHRAVDLAIDEAKKKKMLVIGAHPDKNAVDFREIDYTQPIALVMGGELFGLSEHTLTLVDQTVTIPMHGMGKSLNVSVAAAVILFEFERQRQAAMAYSRCQFTEAECEAMAFEWAQPKFSRFCQSHKTPYPPLDAEGDIMHAD